MVMRFHDQLARRREHPTPRKLVARNGRDYKTRTRSTVAITWWFTSFDDSELDPYVDLGDGD